MVIDRFYLVFYLCVFYVKSYLLSMFYFFNVFLKIDLKEWKWSYYLFGSRVSSCVLGFNVKKYEFRRILDIRMLNFDYFVEK